MLRFKMFCLLEVVLCEYNIKKNSYAIIGSTYEQLEKSCNFIGQKVWEPCANNFIIVGFAD